MDTASAIAIALMTFGTMYPMSVYSGKVLLQVRQPHKSTDFMFLVLLNVLILKKNPLRSVLSLQIGSVPMGICDVLEEC